MNHDKPLDETIVQLIGHICIRDPDTGEIILRRRDIEKTNNDDR